MERISAEEYRKRYGGAATVAPVTPEEPGYLSRATSGIAQGFSQAGQALAELPDFRQTGQTPSLRQEVNAGLGVAEGVTSAAVAPIAELPGLKQIGELFGATGQAVSDVIMKNPEVASGFTKLASFLDQNPEIGRALTTANNVLVLEGAGRAGIDGFNAAKNVSQTAIGNIESTIAGTRGKIGPAVSGAVSETPEVIMNRVARLKPTDYTRFENISGKTPGQYLVETGNFGAPDKIIAAEAEKFATSKTSVDTELGKLPGTYQPGVVQDALEQLVSKAERISTPSVPAKYLIEAKTLLAKFNQNGLTMSEINQVKRLFEREVKLGYRGVGAQINPEAVQQATNIDSAMREWQVNKAGQLGFENIAELNKQTQISKFLIDKLGAQVVGKSGLNGINLTDWIVLSGGNPSSVAGFVVKKFLSTKSVQARIAELLNQKETKGIITPKVTPSTQANQPQLGKLPQSSSNGSTK